jgi:apolipoprotein D and lipocalin family protein
MGNNTSNTKISVVKEIDLNRYVGKWYEISKYLSFFESAEDTNVTATYGLKDGYITVHNSSFRKGIEKNVDGYAVPINAGKSQLKVTFDLQFIVPFKTEGDYWIVRCDPDYQWAVVSNPSKEFLWILSRTSTISVEKYQMILSLLEEEFDTSKLVITPQNIN